MVERDIKTTGVRDPIVLEAMRTVPREAFVPEEISELAYADRPLPIGYEVTISQPAVVALMSELAQLEPGDRVLEIGTGSGYQAAVLDAMGMQVFSIEIIEPLAREAKQRLAHLGYRRVKVRHGDGYAGWPQEAPFDAIIVTAAPPTIPDPLRQQLAIGGRLVLPLGDAYQELVVVTRLEDGFEQRRVIPVSFVPMTGEVRQAK
jgi:protein-L-isoaspartate(D-aspartate) O-methyltransferase